MVQKKTEMTVDRNEFLERYNRNTHRIGRITTCMVLVMLIGAPFLIGAYLGSEPDLGAAGRAFLSVGLVWTVSSVVEFLVYTPMLGAGGGYLAFITGNLINMKIPCAMNARDIVGTKAGTTENEIISALSIATSSLVTIFVLATGVLFFCSPCSRFCRARRWRLSLITSCPHSSELWLISISASFRSFRGSRCF